MIHYTGNHCSLPRSAMMPFFRIYIFYERNSLFDRCPSKRNSSCICLYKGAHIRRARNMSGLSTFLFCFCLARPKFSGPSTYAKQMFSGPSLYAKSLYYYMFILLYVSHICFVIFKTFSYRDWFNTWYLYNCKWLTTPILFAWASSVSSTTVSYSSKTKLPISFISTFSFE